VVGLKIELLIVFKSGLNNQTNDQQPVLGILFQSFCLFLSILLPFLDFQFIFFELKHLIVVLLPVPFVNIEPIVEDSLDDHVTHADLSIFEHLIDLDGDLLPQ
jgi:hypothetical protein